KSAPTRRDIGPTAIFAVANDDGCGHSGDKWNIFRQLLDFDPDGNALREPDPGIDWVDIRQSLRARGCIPSRYTPCDRFNPTLDRSGIAHEFRLSDVSHMDASHLGLLEITVDPKRVRVDHRDVRGSGCRIVADTHQQICHIPIDGAAHLGALE